MVCFLPCKQAGSLRADIHAFVPVPKFHCLVDASGRPGRHRRAVHALVGVHICLDCGVAPGVDDLAANHLCDGSRSELL